MVTIQVIHGDKRVNDPFTTAILGALKHSEHLRKSGKPDLIEVKDGKKVLLHVLPQGDIEEILARPLKVGMIHRLAHDATSGDMSPRQKAAIRFARMIVGMK